MIGILDVYSDTTMFTVIKQSQRGNTLQEENCYDNYLAL